MIISSQSITNIVVLLLLLAPVTFGKPSKRFSLCDLTDAETRCLLTQLSLTAIDYHFTPIANNVDADSINTLQIENSVVPTVGADICEMFSMLKLLYLDGIGLENIEEEAFRGCESLTNIDLSNNKLTKLSASVFLANWRLERVNLKGNALDEACLKAISSLDRLTFLDLSRNNLTTFPVEDIKLLSKLQQIHLYSNKLTDLDVKKLVQYCPRLDEVYINDNELGCLQLREIREEFERSNVAVLSDLSYHDPRQREYTVQYQDGFICLSDTMISLVTTKSRLPILEQELSLLKTNLTEVSRLIPIILEQLNNITAQLVSQNQTIQKLLLSNTNSNKNLEPAASNIHLNLPQPQVYLPSTTRPTRKTSPTYKSTFLNDYLKRTLKPINFAAMVPPTTMKTTTTEASVQVSWVDEIKAMMQPVPDIKQPSTENDYEDYYN